MTLAVILVPLVAAMLVPLLGALARPVAVLAGAATFVLALLATGAPAFSAAWLPEMGINLHLEVSGAAAALVPASALAFTMAMLYACVRVTHRPRVFLALMLGMLAFLSGVFMARDLIVFYIFWDATLIPSLVMLGVWGGSRRRDAVMKYLVYAVGGSLIMLVGIIALKVLSGAAGYGLAELRAAGATLDQTTQLLIFLAFTAAFAVKLPLFPLHSWLIDFHEQNHPSGVADVAGTAYKVGAFGFFAWAIPLLPDGAAAAAPVLLALAAITALYAGIAAAAQTDFKRLLAYASMSHMGIIGVGVFSLTEAGMTGAMLFLAAQILSTGGLFLLSGIIGDRRGTFALSAFGGMARSAPLLASVTLLVLFAFIGVPGLGNFPGEFMSLLGGFGSSAGWGVVATLAVIAAGVYGVNLFQKLFQGPETGPVTEMRPLELLVIVPLVLGILWFGLMPARAADSIQAQVSGTLTAPAEIAEVRQ